MPMGPLGEQLRPQLLSGLAYERLLEEIISGRLPAGHRLRLDLLARSWSVSRTPVREALQRLADMRLVSVSPNAGTRVAHWSAGDMAERARIIGRLASSESLTSPASPTPPASPTSPAPLASPASLTSPSSPDATERSTGTANERPPQSGSRCEITDYLDLAAQLIDHEFCRLGARIVHDHVQPLRLFVVPETAHRHGVNLAPGRARRRALLDQSLEALRRGDARAACDALAALSADLVLALGSSAATPA
ncbi:GntR family transcriptional regulator [Microbacterium sp. NPDC089320]|uniref:GntR family transcriptional regulator n=1 Tax=Microbacterium sp. NPDC089320 TaxID=3155182 RepID=UPI00343C647C